MEGVHSDLIGPRETNRFQWKSTFSIRKSRAKITIILNEVEKCQTESTESFGDE